MKAPTQPSGFQTQLRWAFKQGDVNMIVQLNRNWWSYVERNYEEQAEQKKIKE